MVVPRLYPRPRAPRFPLRIFSLLSGSTVEVRGLRRVILPRGNTPKTPKTLTLLRDLFVRNALYSSAPSCHNRLLSRPAAPVTALGRLLERSPERTPFRKNGKPIVWKLSRGYRNPEVNLALPAMPCRSTTRHAPLNQALPAPPVQTKPPPHCLACRAAPCPDTPKPTQPCLPRHT